MGHALHHALSSARRFGGVAEDYLPLHGWFDEVEGDHADFRHRALRHHAEGIFTLERIFGTTITASTGREVPVRLIGEQHVIEDLRLHPELRRLGALHTARALDGPGAADPSRPRSVAAEPAGPVRPIAQRQAHGGEPAIGDPSRPGDR